MTNISKQLSNPSSTGGAGPHFEAHVQASFVVLMLTGGFAPCLPCWPISKIKLQGKHAGYDTDDLIVFVEQPESGQKRKIFGNIKLPISITEKGKEFGEVIQAAWNDFNNTSLFTRNNDVIALITGPLSAADVNDVRTILEWARHSENAEEFIRKVELANFSSQSKQSKLQAFRTNLNNANVGNPVPDEMLVEFLKHFHLLVYDLDIKAGVTLSLLHSLIGQYSQENVQSLWTRLIDEVQSANKNAGTITAESLPEDLRDAFKQRVYDVIPTEFSVSQFSATTPDWNQQPHASDLAITILIGAWDEKSKADLEILHQLVKAEYDAWIPGIREVLQLPQSPVALKGGQWRVTKRKELWKTLGTRLFDKDLDSFKQCVVAVLTERDPKFDLAVNERYAASIYGKVLGHSPCLRGGMAEGLALLGCQPEALIHCSQNKAETIAVLAVREIFKAADWVLWGSLNNLLPVLAEAAPKEFLSAVENALQQSPCPFDDLFSQEGSGMTGENYLTGLLWALETLAWDGEWLFQTSEILGELATHDPGGRWTNRPANSLKTIFLPWLPQTTAPIEKRKAALRTLQKEIPEVAWKLLLGLLPNQGQISMGTHKPSWRNIIPDDWQKGVTPQEHWEQVSYYAELAISMAGHDIGKLTDLVVHLNNLPQPSFDKLLEELASEAVCCKPEDDRLTLWNRLTEFTSKHKRFSDTEWTLNFDLISKIEAVAEKLAPKNKLNLYRRLFSGRDHDLYEEKGNWQDQRQKLEQQRKQAIEDILAEGGMDSVTRLAESAESPYQVGFSLGTMGEAQIDTIILPALLDTENKKLAQFANAYVIRRHCEQGWAWADGLDKSTWSVTQTGQFLSYLPFTEEAWSRANAWLGKFDREYWSRVNANSYGVESDIKVAINKLIEYERPHAAIDCLNAMLHDQRPLDKPLSMKALIAARNSPEPSYAMDSYHIVEIIKALQDDSDTDPDDLFRVEWAYLPLLDPYSGASPKLLENRLASDPAFFWDVIRHLYRSKNEGESEKEPSEQEISIATNAERLLRTWRTPPGIQSDGVFLEEQFKKWLEQVKKMCEESGHLEFALNHIGKVLVYCPSDPQGLWINQTVAEALNARDAEKMREGFSYALFYPDPGGIRSVDPTGEEQSQLAQKYRKQADEVENNDFQRLAATLRGLAEDYDSDAKRNIADHNWPDIDNT